MIKGIHHVAIAVRSLDDALPLYEKMLGVKASKIEMIPQQGVKAALIPLPDGSEIELLEPTDSQGGVAKFVESRGGGLHHICLEVDDVDKELDELGQKGFQLIDHSGRPGLAGKVGFIHPKSVHGVLIELAQSQY
jgi:methylmalonyl-CoA epimerase